MTQLTETNVAKATEKKEASPEFIEMLDKMPTRPTGKYIAYLDGKTVVPESKYVPKHFFDLLLKHNFSIVFEDQEAQVFRFSDYWNYVEFNGASMRVEQDNSDDEERFDNMKLLMDVDIPQTFDQFRMMMHCVGVINLPKDYISDQQKIELIEMHLKKQFILHESLLQGSDNSSSFYRIQPALKAYESMLEAHKTIVKGGKE